MIVTTINDNAYVEHFDTYLAEQEEFQKACALWRNYADKIVNEKNSEKSAVFFRTTDTMVYRSVDNGIEEVVTVAFVPDNGIMKKQWKREDRIIENSQGGTTHLKGWYLE